jgi:hypothetical protein
MSKPAADCCDCKHWREGDTDSYSLSACAFTPFRIDPSGYFFACVRGHRPRFYKPLYEGDYDYGWKRRCEDFAERVLRGEEEK